MNNLNLPKKVGTKFISCFIHSTSLLPHTQIILTLFMLCCSQNALACKSKGKEKVMKVSDDDGTGETAGIELN